MKFHKQEHIVVRNDAGEIIQAGSCYPTVLACMLDLEINEVPNFQLLYWSCQGQKENLAKYFTDRYLGGKHISEFEQEDYRVGNFNRNKSVADCLWDTVRSFWLASKGYQEDYIEDIDQWLIENPNTPYMASGKSSRGVDHIVIYMNGSLYHDPHPSNEGLAELWPKHYAFQILTKF
jgi:hypothetical protein